MLYKALPIKSARAEGSLGQPVMELLTIHGSSQVPALFSKGSSWVLSRLGTAAGDKVLSPGLILHAAQTLHHLFGTEMALSCAVHRPLLEFSSWKAGCIKPRKSSTHP